MRVVRSQRESTVAIVGGAAEQHVASLGPRRTRGTAGLRSPSSASESSLVGSWQEPNLLNEDRSNPSMTARAAAPISLAGADLRGADLVDADLPTGTPFDEADL